MIISILYNQIILSPPNEMHSELQNYTRQVIATGIIGFFVGIAFCLMGKHQSPFDLEKMSSKNFLKLMSTTFITLIIIIVLTLYLIYDFDHDILTIGIISVLILVLSLSSL